MLDPLVRLLAQNPLLLLFLVAAIGYPLGRLRFRGSQLDVAAGLYAGALTNTPALAGAIETLKQSAPAGALAQPVVAYSITYPMRVIGVVPLALS